MKERKYFIDNLRWCWIIMLIPFHGAMPYNCWEGNYIWLHENKILSSLVIFIAPWYMPLLFLLAGISARYALTKRSYKQFALERVQKLLIPLVTGILTVVAFMTYIADKFHNGYNEGFIKHYKTFFTNISDMTGYEGFFSPGHLWFILFLFIISILSLLIIALQKKLLPKLSFSNLKTFMLSFLGFLPLIMTPILDFGGKSIGGDFALYLLGYYIFSDEDILKKVTKYRYVYLVLMLISDIILTYSFVLKGNQSGLLESICNPCAAWFGILAFMGIARCNFNQNNKFIRYMASRSFLIYIFHFGWLVAVQYLLYKLALNTALSYLISIVVTLVLTLLTCELVKRIPLLSFLFGVSKKKKI